MQTNLMSALYSTKLLTKNMIRKRSGCIINISSMLGVKGGKGCVTYAASKAGMIGKFLNFEALSSRWASCCKFIIHT